MLFLYQLFVFLFWSVFGSNVSLLGSSYPTYTHSVGEAAQFQQFVHLSQYLPLLSFQLLTDCRKCSITRVLKAKHAGLKVAIYLFSLFFFLHLIMRNNIYSLQYSWVHISISRVNVFCFFLPQPHWPHLHITISLLQMNWTPTWGETSPQHWIHTTNTQVWAQVSPHTHARTCMHTAAVTEFLTIWMWESFNNRGNTGAGVQGGGGA